MNPAELEAATFAQMPEAFFRRATAAVYQAHATAWTECDRAFAPSEAENLLPIYRRAKLEQNLSEVADLFPGVEAPAVRTNGSWWHHREVRAGRFVLTESAVPDPCGPVRPSEFRTSLAASAQLSFFDEPEDEGHIYVLLLHSRFVWTTTEERRQGAHLPGSIYLAWPTPELTYAHTVNLVDRYPEVVQRYMPADWSEEAVVKYLGRARRSATGFGA